MINQPYESIGMYNHAYLFYRHRHTLQNVIQLSSIIESILHYRVVRALLINNYVYQR